jgi:DNA phosphorothioation-dependent restriction protein DptH
MSAVVQVLRAYLAREMQAAMLAGVQGSETSQRKDSLRFAFAGPPRQLLESLFATLTEDAGGFTLQVGSDDIPVPIFLVDAHAPDPIGESRAARCSPNYLVTMRNHGYPCLLILHEVGAAINQSITTATKPLGLSRDAAELDDWLNEPLVAEILRKAFASRLGVDASENATAAVRRRLAEAWRSDERNRDKRECWETLGRIATAVPSQLTGHASLAAVLGLPSCGSSEFGTKAHLDTLDNVAVALEERGLSQGFEELENAAGDDAALISALRDFRAHLRMSGLIEAGEFAKAPMHFYTPVLGEGGAAPDWWLQLSHDAWARLLATNPPPSGRLDVRVDPVLATTPRGMPFLAARTVRLTVAIADLPEPLQVTVSRANGQSKLQQVASLLARPEEVVSWEDQEPPAHERFLRYRIEAQGYTPVTIKVIVLEQYAPGVVALVRNAKAATPLRLNRRARDSRNVQVERWECEISVAGMGYHSLDLYAAGSFSISPEITAYNTNAEQGDAQTRPINRSDEARWTCLIETDEESHFDFTAQHAGSDAPRLFRVYVNAEEVLPTEVSSEFQRLVLENRAAATGEHPRSRVEAANCRATDLEELALEDPQSFRPVVVGPDFIDAWRKPIWVEHPKISTYSLPMDPRPSATEFSGPAAFLEARKAVIAFLRPDSSDTTPSAGLWPLYALARDNEFVEAVRRLADVYLDWLEHDYDSAVWSDLVSIHASQPGVRALEPIPYAILLTPLHPIRLAWQCQAQQVLQRAVDHNARCPAASTLTPSVFPDCLLLPCRTGAGSIVRKPFAAMSCSSDYWSVLWSVDAVSRLGRSTTDAVFTPDFGITVDGLSSGFSASQVMRSLDEVRRLLAGRTTLSLSVCADNLGSGDVNEGIEEWCAANVGPDGDHWAQSGKCSLDVVDRRDVALQPEQAAMASLTSKTDSAIRWFDAHRRPATEAHDLAIVAHLGAINHEFSVQGLRSAVDHSGLSRWRVRKQVAGRDATFIAESRVAEKPHQRDRDTLVGALLSCVDHVESRCRESFDSYVFAPNLDLLGSAIRTASYCAVSSTSIDAACFFGASGNAYLWDYELPSYARRAGVNGGYFLLAKQSPSMITAVASAVALLGHEGELPEEQVAGLLDEISRRGMPTLKRLTAGGAMSLGEIGMLVTLRLLQSEFGRSATRLGLLPVLPQNSTLNLVVPVDPFANQCDDLRHALDVHSGERPDLLVLSLRFDGERAVQLKITPLEVKTRTAVLTGSDRVSALRQAKAFSEFLLKCKTLAGDTELWGVAWRNLVATLLDYGFRVYGQLTQFMQLNDWALRHSAALRALATNDLMIEIDDRGRLVVVDATNSSTAADVDNDAFEEAIILSRRDALNLLVADAPALIDDIRRHVGDWDLTPSTRDDHNNAATRLPRPATVSRVQTMPAHAQRPSSETTGVRDPFNSEREEGPLLQIEEVVATEQPITPEEMITTEPPPAPRGIRFVVGHTIHSFGSEAMSFYPGNTALNHLNIGIVGDLGTGKTQLVQSLLYQMRCEPADNRGKRPNILIFDYKRDYSKPEFVAATGARVIAPHRLPLNLFDTSASTTAGAAWLERSKFFIDVLEKLYSGIGPKQRQRIKQAVRTAYESAATGGRTAPTLRDVFDSYVHAVGNDVDAPYAIMSDLVDGEYFVDHASDTAAFRDFLQGVVVVDLASVGQDDRTKNMLVVVFLNLFYEHMLRIEKKPFLGTTPQTRFVDTMLLVDEADNIMQYEFDVLKKVLLQGREFGVGVLLASQYLSHFRTTHENYAEPLLSWFVHKIPNLTVRDLESIGITSANIDMVNTVKALQCHECLYKTAGVDGRFMRGTPFYELLQHQ